MTILLQQIPYVNGLPDTGQSRVNWIKNGEPLEGASTKFGLDGQLNRGSVQVQENVEVLDANVQMLGKASDLSIQRIEHIEDSLSIIGDTSAVKQIGLNTKDIVELKDDTLTHGVIIQDHELRIGFLEEELGEYNPDLDTTYRPVRDDLLWIKTEMGQYPGQDINGVPLDGALASGMKRRIIDTAFEVNKNGQRLTALENQFTESDVGALTVEVGKIRKEIGAASLATSDNIYSRLNRLGNSTNGLAMDMESVLDSIGYTSGVTDLHSMVVNNTNDISDVQSALSSPGTGVVPRLNAVENAIGTASVPSSINGRIKINSDGLASLNTIVGKDTSSGLRGQVAWINQVVGIVPDGSPIPPTSVIGQINTLSTLQNQLASTVQDIQVDIGNNNEGLKGQVLRLNSLMMGTNPAGGTVEERGVLATVKTHDTDIAGIKNRLTGFIPEAPIDGKAYVRKDGSWVDLETIINP